MSDHHSKVRLLFLSSQILLPVARLKLGKVCGWLLSLTHILSSYPAAAPDASEVGDETVGQLEEREGRKQESFLLTGTAISWIRTSRAWPMIRADFSSGGHIYLLFMNLLSLGGLPEVSLTLLGISLSHLVAYILGT